MREKNRNENKTRKTNTFNMVMLFFALVIVFVAFNSLYDFTGGSNGDILEEDSYTDNNGEEPPDLNREDEALSDLDNDNEEESKDNNENEENFPLIQYEPGEIDLDYLIEEFQHLQNPMPGTVISWKDAHLPGAERPYRKGIHQGLDFYAAESGGGITLGSPVQAAASGEIVRIDHDYEEPSIAELAALGEKCRELGKTPEDILDVFRGRQIWVKGDKGEILRYCHMNEVASGLKNGDYISAGQKVGTMGYSGTTEPERPHLHLEIWIEDHYLGEGMTVNQIRSFFQSTIFN